MSDDSGGWFVVALSLFGIWAAGYAAVQIIGRFWKPLLVAGAAIGVVWLLLTVWEQWAEDRERWQRLERDWYDTMAYELDLLRLKARRIQRLFEVYRWQRRHLEDEETE